MRNKFRVALIGILTGLRHRSIILQFALGAMAVLAGSALGLSAMEWTAVIICIAMVIMAEMFNTCIELLCDLHTREYNEMIKAIKDIAAGAVLIASIGALLCALIILYRHLGGIL